MKETTKNDLKGAGLIILGLFLFPPIFFAFMWWFNLVLQFFTYLKGM